MTSYSMLGPGPLIDPRQIPNNLFVKPDCQNTTGDHQLTVKVLWFVLSRISNRIFETVIFF